MTARSMQNKYLFLLVCGLLFPIPLYLLFITVQNLSVVTVSSIGVIDSLLSDVKSGRVTNKKSTTVTFVGDVMLARNVEYLLKSRGSNYPFTYLEELFAGSDTVVGNFESAVLKNHIKTPSFTTTFSVDSLFLPLLTKAGFTHMSLANNHSFDYGPTTFVHTETALKEAGLSVLGNPNQVTTSTTAIITSGDYIIGLLAINRVFSDTPWADVVTKIKELEAQSDYQIAFVHWGEEYILKHNSKQEEFAKKMIDTGIDAVVGHHPHVTQDIEVYKNKPIFYSIGNFIFDQYFSVDVQQGLLLKLNITTSTAAYTIVPISSEGALSQPALMAGQEATLFLKNLARRSDPNFAQNIKAGLLILPFDLATSSQNSMIES